MHFSLKKYSKLCSRDWSVIEIFVQKVKRLLQTGLNDHSNFNILFQPNDWFKF